MGTDYLSPPLEKIYVILSRIFEHSYSAFAFEALFTE